MRVKSRKPPAENATTSDLQVLARARSRCRRSCRRSDAAGARSPPAPCRGGRPPSSRPACRPPPTAASTLPTASGAVSGGGVRMHQRSWNNSAKPASGPECSVPATGWPGTKCTPPGNSGCSVSIDRLLDRADIGDDRAVAQCRRDPRGRSRHRPTAASRARRDRRPAPPAPGRRSSRRRGRAGAPLSSVSARRAQATIVSPGMSRRNTRASDEPISPIPISATRSNSLSLIAAGHEFGQRRGDALHLLAGADRDAQVLRQAVAAHLAR